MYKSKLVNAWARVICSEKTIGLDDSVRDEMCQCTWVNDVNVSVETMKLSNMPRLRT